MRRRRRTLVVVGSCVAVLAVIAGWLLLEQRLASTPDNAAFHDAFSAGRPQEVTVQGTVQELLSASSGRDGTHQRFTVVVDTVVVEIDHNTTLAPPVPVRPGDTVTVHGQFEPDPGRPVIHFTHHATSAGHTGGWIEVNGQRYE